MPTYFFHIREGDTLSIDSSGEDLPDLNAARWRARNLVEDELKRGTVLNSQAVEICDRSGALQTTVSFSDAIKLGQKAPH